GERVRSGVAASLLHALGTALAGLLVLAVWAERRPAAARATIVALVGLDFLVAGARINPSAPRELLAREPEVLPWVREAVGAGRLYRDAPLRDVSLRAPSNDVVWQVR